MIDVKAIRRKYPDPRKPRFDDSTPNSYCVGGALCQFLGADASLRFPAPGEIIPYLLQANPHLDRELASAYAKAIVYHNDAARFDEAWDVLGKALRYLEAKAA